MRTIEDIQNIHPTVIFLNESWDYVKKGKLCGLRSTTKEMQLNELQEYQIKYPLIWEKGSSKIALIQFDYYQHETEEGGKLWGYANTAYFKTKTTPQKEFIEIINGVHPGQLGYKLTPIQ